ncbi:MAG: hypothetical protein J6P03_08125 [Opitutales bacterium]|nr:hypothetical protein [Opitutales bacterium]
MTVLKNRIFAALALSASIFLGGSLFAENAPSKTLTPGSKHGSNPIYTSYAGRVMAGYQGWFRAPGDGSGRGWVHWGRESFGERSCTVEALPDMAEYEHAYDSEFRDRRGNPVKVFSSYDYQTVDTHFKWMKEYNIDGVMVQRFFGSTHPRFRRDGAKILEHAVKASQKYGRALVVMYDLSGARPNRDVSERLIEDWKFLVDELKVTGGQNTSYMFHNGGPLVSIWGLGFIDRPYELQSLGIEKFIKFLKEDKEYGGCSVMLGVPPTFRTLDADTRSDPRLHEIIKSADVVSPWNPGRFSLDGTKESKERLEALLSDRVSKDVEFCKSLNVDYAPVIYPGFSWHNLMKTRGANAEFNSAPRLKGEFYWTLARSMISNGSKMIYVAMFDEVDEGTAILKILDSDEDLPVNTSCRFLTTEGMGGDYYLWLTGEIGKVLRGEAPLGPLPARAPKNPAK